MRLKNSVEGLFIPVFTSDVVIEHSDAVKTEPQVCEWGRPHTEVNQVTDLIST